VSAGRFARALACAGALAALGLVVPVAAGGAGVPVTIQFQAFAPSQIDVLPGDTVEWSNVSQRRHTVTAFDGSFDSGDLFGGDSFSHEFDDVGVFAYHCTVHLNMTGEVDVSRVILDPLPVGPVPAGARVEVSGRTADPGTPVTVERAVGGGFQPAATATPAPDGIWSATVPAVATSDYRATVGADSSASRRLLVTDRKLHVHATRAGLSVTVTPADPHAEVVLQLRLRERFGWWPSVRERLDYLSRADFRVRRRAPARVVLVDRDGWTALATSPVIRVGSRVTPTRAAGR
jgi:plastocyanin